MILYVNACARFVAVVAAVVDTALDWHCTTHLLCCI